MMLSVTSPRRLQLEFVTSCDRSNPYCCPCGELCQLALTGTSHTFCQMSYGLTLSMAKESNINALYASQAIVRAYVPQLPSTSQRFCKNTQA